MITTCFGGLPAILSFMLLALSNRHARPLRAPLGNRQYTKYSRFPRRAFRFGIASHPIGNASGQAYCALPFVRYGPMGAQCVLRVILDKPDLTVESVKTQEVLFGATGRRAVLDVLATDSIGSTYDIEVQRVGDGANPLRARYYSSLLDASMLAPGAGYDELHEKYVIFITETDVFGRGLPAYRFSRTLEGDGMSFGDRDHIVYVNGANRNAGTALGKLMQDFFCRSADGMHYDELKKRTK